MTDKRKRNVVWHIKTNTDGTTPQQDAHLAVLMDIRDEMQAINAKLDCCRVREALDAIAKMHKNGVKIRRTRKRK